MPATVICSEPCERTFKAATMKQKNAGSCLQEFQNTVSDPIELESLWREVDTNNNGDIGNQVCDMPGLVVGAPALLSLVYAT